MTSPAQHAVDRIEQTLGEALLEKLPEIAHDLALSREGLEGALLDALAAIQRQAPGYARVAHQRRAPPKKP